MSDKPVEDARAYFEMVALERALPDIGEPQRCERVRPHVLKIGDRVWSTQDWRTITAISEQREDPCLSEQQTRVRWMGNDHWHCFGEWALRLIGDAA